MTARLVLAAVLALAAPAAAHARAERWIQTWGAAPAPVSAVAPGALPLTTPVFTDQTIVQTVRISAGGKRLRVRLSNAYGKAPLVIGAASLALNEGGGAPVALTFGGLSSITLPPGAPMLSDPVDLPAPPLGSLRIALYVSGKAPACTCHMSGGETVRVSPQGDFTQTPFTPVESPAGTFRAFLTGVEVDSASRSPVIVAFGDSITDGYRSTDGANRRWPDRLAERAPGAAVVNQGLSGNQVLADGALAFFGESALTRFDRDVLAVPGATHVVLLEGVNDLGRGGAHPPPVELFIAAYRQMIARAHEHGVKVIVATVVPYEGAGYFKPEGEAVRQALNAWIRRGEGFDGVVDFDAALRDPARPGRMRADLQSGDWLHPNDAGYRAMGDAIPLRLFAF